MGNYVAQTKLLIRALDLYSITVIIIVISKINPHPISLFIW